VSDVNAFLTWGIDGLLEPFSDLPPLLGLLFMSLLAAVGVLCVLRLTADQARLTAHTRAIHACWFELRLLNHDVLAIWRTWGEMARHHLEYLRALAVPLLLMSVPLALLVGQLQAHYAYGGLDVGTPAILTVRMKPSGAARPSEDVRAMPLLTAPLGVHIETAPVWVPSLREVAWRIAASAPGDYDLAVRVADHEVTKRVRVASGTVRRSPVRSDGSIVQQLLHPSESPLPAEGDIEFIAVGYPRRRVGILGHTVHWSSAFAGFTMLFAFALRGPFHVRL
jgi:hypothetical protein